MKIRNKLENLQSYLENLQSCKELKKIIEPNNYRKFHNLPKRRKPQRIKRVVYQGKIKRENMAIFKREAFDIITQFMDSEFKRGYCEKYFI